MCDSSGSDSDDLVNSFFGFKEPKRRCIAPRPQSEFEIKIVKEEIVDFKRESKGTDYSNKYRAKEEKRLADQTLNLPTTSSLADIDGSDSEDDNYKASELSLKQEKEEADLPELDVYTRYDFNITPQELPILDKKDEILKSIEVNKVLVMTASTGTGKSSQVPQYILEEAQKKKQKCNIIVTQPRRIAATSVAKRVALERKCELGTLVGYQIGLDRMMDTKENSDTRILYCTTGVLLQKLISEKTMRRYTHVILDEVHERDLDMDMLLIVVRRLFATKNPYVKIVLMSATLAAEKISNYFKTIDHLGEYVSAPFLDLNVPRRYPTRTTYLDELEHLGASSDILNIDNPGISHRMYTLAMKAIELVLKKTKGQFVPSFLVFLPGIQEIERMHQELYKRNPNFDVSEFSIVKLHSSLSPEESERAFNSNVSNKIILATNIAESSVTLPGVRFVIDFCLTKYLQADTTTNITQLKLDWASQMSMVQRAGRVGRLEAGQVVRLIYKDQFIGLPVETTPEMQRSTLESVVLKSKRLEMGKPADILGLALDPPSQNAVEDSILMLKEIGAMTRSLKDGHFDPTDGNLTFAGNIMARLPVDVRVSKLIILGSMFSCLEECIIIGAGISSKSVFMMGSMSNEQKMESYHQKLEQAAGSGSDGIAILNVYNKWRNAVEEKNLKGRLEKEWCNLQLLNLKNLRDLHDLVNEIKKRLKIFAIEADANCQLNDEEKLFTIKICIAGAFYPNYFQFGGNPPGREDCKNLNSMNPCTTVFLKGMPPNRIGQIYEKQVRQKLYDENVSDELNEMKVKFDSNSARLQVEFKPIKTDGLKMVPGEVECEVYKAVKLSKIERELEIYIMSKDNEDRFASSQNIGSWDQQGKFVFHKKILQYSNLCIYPKLQQRNFRGIITHIVNCGKFFFQPARGQERLKKVHNILKDTCDNISNLQQALEGSLLIIMHNEMFKRGKIIEMPDKDDLDEDPDFSVYLVDYGDVIEAKMRDFYVCKADASDHKRALQEVFEMPPQCFQCCLSEMIPSALKCSSGWSANSTREFQKFVKNRKVDIFVNSFVDRIASVQLSVTQNGHLVNFGERLIVEGYAQRSDDSYIRLLDQHHRDTENRKDLQEFKILENELVDVNFPCPAEDLLEIKVKLDGPYSTLLSRPETLCRLDKKNLPLDTSVEPSSVNHVLIDPFPNDANKKILVAASMSNRSNRVMLHQTTIMPHLPGMSCLLGLIFSPVAQVRASKRNNRHTSILTGLGCNPKDRKSHYGEHDCMFFVDVELDKKDFEMIKELRHQMSVMMQTVEVGFKKFGFEERKRYARHKIKPLLKEIFGKERKPLGVNMENADWNWKVAGDPDIGAESCYPPVYVEQLMPLSENSRSDLKHHADELKSKADKDSRDEFVKCLLCEEGLEKLVDLKLHLMKKLHKERCLRIRDEALSNE